MEKKRKFVETPHMLYRPHIMISELIKVPAFNFTPGESGFPHKKSSLPLSLWENTGNDTGNNISHMKQTVYKYKYTNRRLHNLCLASISYWRKIVLVNSAVFMNDPAFYRLLINK